MHGIAEAKVTVCCPNATVVSAFNAKNEEKIRANGIRITIIFAIIRV